VPTILVTPADGEPWVPDGEPRVSEPREPEPSGLPPQLVLLGDVTVARVGGDPIDLGVLSGRIDAALGSLTQPKSGSKS
jgi:hypothetical protein